MKAVAPRPGLDDVVGHAAVKASLLRIADDDRLPNGLLLVGADGRGKRTLALAFARELLRRRAGAGGGDRAARLAIEGAHPELLVLEPLPDERILPVRRVRRLLERCSLSVVDGGLRVVVLLRLHRLNEESGNALLKFLEEPPPDTVVLATASDPGSVLETIRSRLRMLPIGPLTDAETARVLEIEGLDPAEAALLAPLAQGAPGAALKYRRGDLESALIEPLRELFGPGTSAYAWAEDVARRAKDAGPEAVEEEEGRGPRAAVAAFAELRAAKEEGAHGETSSAPTQEAARSWLRPLLLAAAYVAQDLARLSVGAAARAPALVERAVPRDAPLRGAPLDVAARAAEAAAACLENLDRNLSLTLALEAGASQFKAPR